MRGNIKLNDPYLNSVSSKLSIKEKVEALFTKMELQQWNRKSQINSFPYPLLSFYSLFTCSNRIILSCTRHGGRTTNLSYYFIKQSRKRLLFVSTPNHDASLFLEYIIDQQNGLVTTVTWTRLLNNAVVNDEKFATALFHIKIRIFLKLPNINKGMHIPTNGTIIPRKSSNFTKEYLIPELKYIKWGGLIGCAWWKTNIPKF